MAVVNHCTVSPSQRDLPSVVLMLGNRLTSLMIPGSIPGGIEKTYNSGMRNYCGTGISTVNQIPFLRFFFLLRVREIGFKFN